MSVSSLRSRIVCPIDFEKDDRQAAYARAPHSRNNLGCSTVEIPIVVMKYGTGTTVLFTGGGPGDEYEGLIAIPWLARGDTGAIVLQDYEDDWSGSKAGWRFPS